MTNSNHHKMAFRLRETIPNPAGGEYAEPTDAQDEARINLTCDILASAVGRILPMIIASHKGSTKHVAQVLATMFAAEMGKFFQANMAEDQKPSLEMYGEILRCFTAQIDSMESTTILKSLGFSDDIISTGKIHVIKV